MVRPRQARLSSGRVWLYAVLLGLAGWSLNTLWLPSILTGQTPRFIFGGIFALVAFMRLGPWPGLLTGSLTLLSYFGQMDAVGWSTVVYLVEWTFIWWFARRWQSLVLAAPIFWLVLGAPLTLLFYGGIAQIPLDYVGILFVKQLLNGTLNALVAEALLALPVTDRILPTPDRRVRLRPALFGRFALGFMALAVLSGLILARTAFDRSLRDADADLISSRQAAAEAMLELLTRNALLLQGLAVEVSVAGQDADASRLDERVVPFHRDHPQFVNVTVLDRTGTVRLNVPAVDRQGDTIPRFNVEDRDYFQEVRRSLAPAISPLILGELGIRSEGVEPILILAVPVLGPTAEFDGVVYGALDASALGDRLEEVLGAEADWTTVLDGDHRVVWAGLPTRPPGTDLGAVMELAPEDGAVFSFQPEVLRTRLDSLEGNVHRGSRTSVPLFDLDVLREQPLSQLYADMRPVALRIGLLLLMAEALVILTSWYIAREVAAPLQAVASVTQEVAAGRSPPEQAFSDLVEADITELSEAGEDLRAMVAAVTEARRLSREAMERSEDRFRATFEQSAAGIALLDEEGCVVLINDRYAALLNTSPEELAGMRLSERTLEEDRRLEEEARAAVRGLGAAVRRVEIRPLRAPDRWLDLLVSRFEDRAGVSHFLQVAQDVTERKALEDRVMQSSKLESVGRLAAGVAHDLNNMLTPIFGYARMALDRSEEDDRVRSWLQQVLRSTERARGLVSQLLAFGRRQTLRLEPLDVNEAIQEFEDTYGLLLRENIRLEVELAPGLAPVEADRSQLQQVLVNLTVNAQDVLEDGGAIHLRTAPAELDGGAPGVELTVWDTGPGMHEELLSKVFEPFFTTKSTGEGTGLGLSSVHGAIRQMGGEIEAANAAEGGFMVRMVLPAAAGEVPTEPADRPPADFSELRQVVVVEDDDAVRSLLDRALSTMGIDGRTFASGEELIDALPGLERPDLLLTDVVLPGMDGLAVRQQILARFPGLPILFMSGYSQEVLHEDEVDGEFDLLAKPFTLEELREAMARTAASTAQDP